MLSNFQKTQTMANWLQLWKTLGFPIIYFRLWKIESEIPINQWSDGGGLPTRIIKNSHLQHGMYLSHYPQWLKIPWKCRIFISNPFYPHFMAFFYLFPYVFQAEFSSLWYNFWVFTPLCTENKASMRKVKEQMRPIRVLYSDTQHTHQMQILVKCKWDAILGDNIILLSRYALLFCMETFLFENRTDAATEPHKNHTMYVHFLSFVGISHFQFAPNLCVIPLLTIQNVLTLTPSDTLNKQISFSLHLA